MNRRDFFKQVVTTVARTCAALSLLFFGTILIRQKPGSSCIDPDQLCGSCPVLQDCNESEARQVKEEKFV